MEPAILVQVEIFREDPPDLFELQELTRTAGIPVAEIIEVKRSRLDPQFFIGEGKVNELSVLLQHHGSRLVIFNHDLSPSQERNLEKVLQVQVMSRTALILEIFAERARTYEGKLQVELAALQYQSTRLVKSWTHLERQRGGIGVRGGPGETQLEIDKRLIRQKIKSIRQDLEKVKSQRRLGRALRQKSNIPVIALVGYTNAGKSTLFNQITQSDVYVANQLFATLDPTLRHFNLPHFGEVIFTDTVGFIRNLPHQLVDAFQATLEETCHADLLLHVIDASHPDYLLQKKQVLTVLSELGAESQPILEIMNKIDLCEDRPPRIDHNPTGEPERVWVSALKNKGLDLIEDSILNCLSSSIFTGVLILRPDQGNLRSILYRYQAVEHEKMDEEGRLHLDLRIAQISLDRILKKEGLAESKAVPLKILRGDEA